MTIYTNVRELHEITYTTDKPVCYNELKMSISIYGDFWQDFNDIMVFLDENGYYKKAKMIIDCKRNKLHISNIIVRNYSEVDFITEWIKHRFSTT